MVGVLPESADGLTHHAQHDRATGVLEMALRNSIHTTLTVLHDRPDWYDAPQFLQQRQARQVSEAETTIANGRINPTWQKSTRTFARFPAVYAEGYQSVERKLRQHLGST